MTYTDIDKQVDELKLCGCSRVCFGHDKLREELRKLIHQIYSQAKAEQREEDLSLAKQALGYHCDTPDCDHNLESFISVLEHIERTT